MSSTIRKVLQSAALVIGLVLLGNSAVLAQGPCINMQLTSTGLVGEKCVFTQSSGAFAFNAQGKTYWDIVWVPSGTVSAASLSVDSSATLGGPFTTGGIIASGTIGSLASPGSYLNSTPTTPTNYGLLTPSVTGSGSVTVVVFGSNTAFGGTTQTISGSVNILGGAGARLDAAAGASAAPNSLLAGGVYNSTVQTPSTGQQEPLQLDANAFLNADVQSVGGTPISPYATLLNNATFTGSLTGSAIRLPGQSAEGVLAIQSNGLTGAPAGCQAALLPVVNGGFSAGTALATQAFTPSTTLQFFQVAVAVTAPAAVDQVQAQLTCGTYPTGGTITVSFAAFQNTQAFLFGHAGGSLDTNANTTLPTAVVDVGGVIQASQANPTAGTTNRQGRFAHDLTGNTYVLDHSPNVFSGFLTISTATTTQVVAAAAAGFSHYITDIKIITTTAGTGSTLTVVTGTGSNCVTGTASISPAIPNTATGTTVLPFKTPLFAGAANAVCITQSATAGTSIVWVTGYDAP